MKNKRDIEESIGRVEYELAREKRRFFKNKKYITVLLNYKEELEKEIIKSK